MTNWILKFRATIVLLLLWLAIVFNVERLHKPINLASFVYPLAGLLAAGIVLIPSIRKATLIEVSIISLALYVVLKWWLGYEFLGSMLPITITECVVLCVTILLSWCVASQIDEFMRSAADISAMQACEEVLGLKEGDAKMYAEVQRARRFQRNLTLATVAFDGEFTSQELERLTKQVRMELSRRYLETRVAKRLLQSTAPGDLVVNRRGEFVVMFPEATEENVRAALREVAKELREELGLQVQIGLAQFPEQECTLTGLIERAEADTQAMEWNDLSAKTTNSSHEEISASADQQLVRNGQPIS
ncbi:MAG: hypothetical protein ACFCD0_01695 [Gemmataceae bacterium]